MNKSVGGKIGRVMKVGSEFLMACFFTTKVLSFTDEY